MAQLQTTAVTGSLTVTGNITAQTLVVQTITSSVSVVTGSTQFGSLTSNTHQFTGSILQSGSLAYFAGSVGIGTSSPGAKLEISTGGSSNGGLRLRHSPYNYWDITSAYNNTDADLQFIMAGSEKMRLNASGNVGIGTTSPSAKLHVVGDSIFNGLKTIQLDRTVAAAVNSYTDIGTFDVTHGAHSMIISVNASISSYSVAKSYIISNQYSGTSGVWTVAAPISDSGPYTDNFELLVKFDGSVCSLRIRKSTGSSSTGTYSVTILYTGYTSATFTSSTSTGTDSTSYNILGSSLITQVDGQVGIGTTSPQSGVILDAKGGAAIAGGTEGLRIGSVGDNSAYDNIKIYYTGYNSGAPRVYLTPRTTPGSGVVNSFLYLQNSNGSSTTSNNTMGLLVDGSVGIGTTSPSYKLHISGNLYVDHNDAPIATFVRSGGTNANTVIAFTNATTSTYIGSNGTLFGLGGSTGAVSNNPFIIEPSATEKIRLTSGGSVGIGTTSPTRQLELYGNDAYIQLTRSSTAYQSTLGFNTGATNDWLIRTGDGSTSDLQFYSYGNSSYVMTILRSNGNVGIGTTSPTVNLDIENSSGWAGLDLNGSSGGEIRLQQGGVTYGQIYANSPASSGLVINAAGAGNDIYFQSAGSTKMVMLDSGNVGIGTTNPIALLHVAAGSGAGSSTYLYGEKSGGYGATQHLINYINAGGEFIHFDWIGSSGTIRISQDSYNAGGSPSSIRFLTTPSGGSLTERMRVTSDGNVGIGTTTPGDLLHIGNTTTGGNLRIVASSYGNNGLARFFGTDNGEKLQIGALGSSQAFIFTPTSVDLAIYAGNSERMRINASGSVGIGTTSPSSLLSVQGNTDLGNSYGSTTSSTYTTRISGYAMRYDASNRYGNYGLLILNADSGWTASARRFMLTNGLSTNKFAIIRSVDSTTDPSFGDGGVISSGTADFVIDNGGNIGIGITTPSTKLHIYDSSATNMISVQNSGGGGASTIGNDSSGNLYIKPPSNIYFQALSGTNSTIIGTAGQIILNSSSNTTFTGAGNVGIGTTSPSTTLHVRTDTGVLIKGASSTTDAILSLIPASGGRQYDFRNYGSSFGIKDNSADVIRMYFHYDGNVGIGDSGPSSRLHVYTNGVGSSYNGIGMDNGAQEHYWYLEDNTTSVHSIGSTAGQWKWINSNGTHVTIVSGGSVGIGTTSPALKLEVVGGIRIASNNWINTSLSSLIRDSFFGYSSGYRVVQVGANDGTHGLALGVDLSGNASGNFNGGEIIIPNNRAVIAPNAANNNYVGVLRVGSDNNLYIGGSAYNVTGHMFINLSNGNVGIGTTSPVNVLHVYGGASTPSTSANNGIVTVNAANGVQLSVGVANASPYGVFFQTKDANNAGPYNYPILLNPSNGNVGIGTTSPAYKLDVNGTTRTTDNTILASGGTYVSIGSAPFYAGTNVTSLSIGGTFYPGIAFYTGSTAGSQVGQIFSYGATGNMILAADPSSVCGSTTMQFEIDGSTKMLINANGNVGIGTTSPSRELHIKSSDGAQIMLEATSVGSWNGIQLSSGNGTYSAYFGQNDADGLFFIDNASNGNDFVITQGGNVGIGVTSPLAKLHAGVNVSDYSSYSFTNTGAVITSVGVDHTASRTNVLALMRDGTSGVVYAGLAAFDLSRYEVYSVDARTQLDIRLAHTDTNTLTDVLSLRSNGNVGIGSTSPGYKLDVQGNAGLVTFNTNGAIQAGTEIIAGSGNFASNSSGTDVVIRAGITTLMTLKSGGNIGIGTTNPGYKLHVSGNLYVNNGLANGSGVSLFVQGSGDMQLTDGGSIFWGDYTYANGTYIRGYDNSDIMYFYLNGTNMAYFRSDRAYFNCNVGIGSSSPGYKLDVTGTIRATADVIAYSDARVKENVKTIEAPLELVTKLRGVTYTRKDTEDKTEKVGVIAQEVLEVLPQVVQQDAEGNYSVAYGNIVGVLIEAIKELKAEINELKNNK